MSQQEVSWQTSVRRGYVLLRIAMGLNICVHGITRWSDGLRVFAGSLVTMFQHTILPSRSVYAFGLVLPIFEALIGGMVLLGFRTVYTLVAGAGLMLALTFGSALRQDWQVVGIQLIYSFVYSVLIAASQYDSFSLDHLFTRTKNNL